MCVPKCPLSMNYFGDRHTGRCVLWCTEGTYAENVSQECVGTCPDTTFADNLTRKCVTDCPPE